jgi:hypothetical protein
LAAARHMTLNSNRRHMAGFGIWRNITLLDEMKLFEDRCYSDESPEWLDSQWFDRRPNRTRCLRPIHPIEIFAFPGASHVLVCKVNLGTRLRIPMVASWAPAEFVKKLCNDRDDAAVIDAHLSWIACKALSAN